MLVTTELTVATDFHCMEKNAMNVDVYHQLFSFFFINCEFRFLPNHLVF